MSDRPDHPVVHAIATIVTVGGLAANVLLGGKNYEVGQEISALQCQQTTVNEVTNQLPPSPLQQTEVTVGGMNDQSEQSDQVDAVQTAKEEEEERAG